MKNKLILLTLLAGGLLTGIPFNLAAADAADLKYGLYIHFGMDTFRHPGEKGQLPAERFAPATLDVKAWTRTAKEAGMTFAILTAKHESGFCLWRSTSCDYNIGHSPYGGDAIKAFIEACQASGITPGVHYSIPDAFKEGTVRYRGMISPAYFDAIKKQITELLSLYPQLKIMIFDAVDRLTPEQSDELDQLMKRINPGCEIWKGYAGDQGPHHVAATTIKSWMWRQNAPLNNPDQILARYKKAQSQGKAFVLSVGPDQSGYIPADQTNLLRQLKSSILNSEVNDSVSKPELNASERLKKAKSLYDQGLINKEEYDRKVKEVMDSF